MIPWGFTKDQDEVQAVVLKNGNGMEVTLISFGAVIQSIRVPDAQGNVRDVVLGYDTVEEYEQDTEAFGAIVGRNANRIGKASFTLDGVRYVLEANAGEHNLHSGKNGVQHKNWKLVNESESSCTFAIVSEDMEQGFPGRLTAQITYELTKENELCLSYRAETDKPTVVNMTNHVYLNLDGHGSGSVLNHKIRICADRFTPVSGSDCIPTGELRSVKGTPLDLREAKRIGDEIESDYEQMRFGNGYDHNYVLGEGKGMKLAAVAQGAESGIRLELSTEQPGLQFYTGNWIPEKKGKAGASYARRTGFCLETQVYPDAVNRPEFPSTILRPGEEYKTRTIFKFCTGE